MITGLTLLIIVGIIWTLTGVVMGGASRHGVDTKLMQLASSICQCIICLALIATHAFEAVTVTNKSLLCFALLLYFAVGILAYVLNETMARAMERGPNGLVWAILQSGMLLPFIFGLIFHGEPVKIVRIIGMFLLLVALALMSTNQKQPPKEVKGKSWIALSFIAFVICGIQQTINNEPAYYEEIRNGLPSVYRYLACGVGCLLTSLLSCLMQKAQVLRSTLKTNLKLPYFWLFSMGFQVTNAAAVLYMQYNGMDRLAAVKLGAISYPVLVISCIASFSLFSILFLHEKLTWRTSGGLACCVLGMIYLGM